MFLNFFDLMSEIELIKLKDYVRDALRWLS